MSFHYSPKVVTDGLVLYLDAANPLSYTSGSLNWNDLSRSQTSGSLINGPTFSSANNGSIVFDGVNDSVNLPEIGTNIGKTYLLWVRNTSTSSGVRFAYSHRDPDRVYLGVTGTDLYLRAGTDSGFISGVTLTQNTWFFLGIRINSPTEYEGFVNNSSVGIRATTLSTSTGTGLGAYYTNTNNPLDSFWAGNVASVQIYNRALSASEILQNYNATKGRFGLT